MPSSIVSGNNIGNVEIISYYDIKTDQYAQGNKIGYGPKTGTVTFAFDNTFSYPTKDFLLDSYLTFTTNKPLRAPATGAQTNAALKLKM